MSRRSATVLSIDVVRRLKVALEQFAQQLSEALVTLELESRRPLQWIETDRARYWPKELRKASDRLAEAKLALERCQLTADPSEHRSCYDERKMVEKAKRRLELCERKIPIVRQWRGTLRKEIEEFKVQLARLNNYLEADLPRALASLERMATALEQYVQSSGLGASSGLAAEATAAMARALGSVANADGSAAIDAASAAAGSDNQASANVNESAVATEPERESANAPDTAPPRAIASEGEPAGTKQAAGDGS